MKKVILICKTTRTPKPSPSNEKIELLYARRDVSVKTFGIYPERMFLDARI